MLEICYGTCDSVECVKSVIYSNDVQERHSSILKPLSIQQGRKRKQYIFGVTMRQL